MEAGTLTILISQTGIIEIKEVYPLPVFRELIMCWGRMKTGFSGFKIYFLKV